MTVKYDRSSETVVVWCTECPSFAEMADGYPHCYDIGDTHERAVHPTSTRAASARAHWLRLHLVG